MQAPELEADRLRLHLLSRIARLAQLVRSLRLPIARAIMLRALHLKGTTLAQGGD